ncbi:ATP-binding region ATPase domain protein (plasmid) [Gemmatirosa kalamazoonensis]|uniref:histidine kinase n=1 Tax=Gemmatirosa kalamazoonensis TaxID=861299 RepID=W0RS99_9BACT|nr:HAMP domain-containing sensor histidine kinase [Gemmatirosa kalamazoonensis]AHG92468.1 ATP-binding region ATPase domain protein [Gemmatirosa kalamazoonensis]
MNTHPDPTEGWEVDRPLPQEFVAHSPRMMGHMMADHMMHGRLVDYTAGERRWINDTISRQVRGAGRLGYFPVVLASYDGVPRLLVYTVMPTSWGDTLVYGAEYPRSSLEALFREVMNERALLPETFARGRRPREVLRLQVSDAHGTPLFDSDPGSGRWTLDDTTRLPKTYGSVLVRAQIRPELAGTLVIGGLPKSRLPFLLGILGLSAALALVALGQIRREGELARMRADFVSSISHELRTPLAQMRVYLETLRLGRFTTEEQRRWSLDNVERETTRLGHLVERVLRFSGVGRRLGGDVSRAPEDVSAETARIVDEFRPLAAARRATVTCDAEPTPTLRLQEGALRHVLLNLLDNAVKYGPTGQTVHVRVRSTGDRVRLEVHDEGPGVPAADRQAIWRPYQRGRTAGHTSGSGIGLAIVHDVVSQHGGRAWVADDDGRAGATFVVELPADRMDAPSAAARVHERQDVPRGVVTG